MNKILVIDDEEPTLAMSRLLLGAYGYDVLTAENGQKGIKIFEAERPPIVLTDIKMPGINGLEVLKKIKDLDPDTEVIVITGHGDMELALEALNLNATDFINKPVQKEALETALNRAEERLKLTKKRPADNISLSTTGEMAIVDIKGNVTSLSEPFLLAAYEKASDRGVKKLLIRFDKNCSITGTGIAILIQLLSEIRKRGQEAAISGISGNLKKIFDMVGITTMAAVYDVDKNATLNPDLPLCQGGKSGNL